MGNIIPLETERLILRRFTPWDVEALLLIYSDEKTNRFLPWFPICTKAEAERLLPAGIFHRCHRSYLVNLTWVERATHAGVLLKNGEWLPMGRTFYPEFQNALIRRLNG